MQHGVIIINIIDYNVLPRSGQKNSLKGVGTAPPEELTGCVNGFGSADSRYLLRIILRNWEITPNRSQTRFYTP